MKQELLSCLPELDAAYRANLLETFLDMTDEQLAEHLQDMVSYGGICYTEEDTH
jgi:hypothetical protein